MSLVKIGEISTINTGGHMEQAKKLWALALAHKKISIAVAVVVVLLFPCFLLVNHRCHPNFYQTHSLLCWEPQV